MVRMTRFVIAVPRRVLIVAVVLLALCGVYGFGAAQHLLSGGYSDPNSESAQAQQVLDDTFERGGVQVVLKLDGPPGMDLSLIHI